MDADTLRAAQEHQRNLVLWELGRVGKCWFCGARTAETLPDGRSRCPGCQAKGLTGVGLSEDLKAPDPDRGKRIEVSLRKVPAPGVLPRWWTRMPACKAERDVRVAAVADGRRPEIDRPVLFAPDKVRAARDKVRLAGWTVWTAYCDGAGVGGRDRILMVAYRGRDMAVMGWDLATDGTWKAGRVSWWTGRYPFGETTWTVAMKRMTAVPNSDLPAK